MSVTMAVTSSIKEKMGERLEKLGYTLVEVTWDDRDEPRLLEEVDCLFFSLDFFKAVPSDLTKEQHERRREVGRDMIVPKVRHWVHVPSAGLNHWQDIFAGTRLATTEERRGEAGKDGTLVLTHGAGVMGLPMGEYCVSHILSIAKRIPLHIDMQREQKWEKVMQRGLSSDVLGILGCGGAFAFNFLTQFLHQPSHVDVKAVADSVRTHAHPAAQPTNHEKMTNSIELSGCALPRASPPSSAIGIGLHTARLLRAFGTRILATKRSVKAHLVTAEATEEERLQLDDNETELVDEWYARGIS